MKKIYIHQGHSEADSGAVGADGFKESDFTKAVGEKLAAKLTGAGYTTYLSRERLPNAKSTEVAHDANTLDVDLVVSIHANDAGPTAHGAEVFITGVSNTGRLLAEAVHEAFTAAFPDHTWRGIKLDTESAAGRLAILRIPAAPALLIEPGFLSNVEERDWLESDDTQDQIAEALASAITTCVPNDPA